MELHGQPRHPALQQSDAGSNIWWESVQRLGTPLIHACDHKTYCTFLWRQSADSESYILIDIYSKTPSIYEQWNLFSSVAGTDIWYFETCLPHDWSGSYVLAVTEREPPTTSEAAKRRIWWQEQLQQHAQIDPFSHFSPYNAQIARWVNQLHLGSTVTNEPEPPMSSRLGSFNWHSELQNSSYPVDLFSTATAHCPQVLPLIILLDGQVWSQQLPLFSRLQQLTRQRQIQPALYACVHSSTRRAEDYGCCDRFSQALIEELIPQLKEHCSLVQFSSMSLAGQSLGGLCAMHTSLLFPSLFSHVIAQSGSYWWSDFSHSRFAAQAPENFLDLLRRHPVSPTCTTRYYLRAGSCETDMREDAYQLYTLLGNPHAQVHFAEFTGGHDAVNWRQDLISTLEMILS